MPDVVSAKYNMVAEVYEEIVLTEESGFSKRGWDYTAPAKTIICDARLLIPFGNRISFVEQWGEQYSDAHFLTVYTKEFLTNRQRLGKVKIARTNNWVVADNTIFDVLSVFPIIDPLGKFLEYQLLAAEVVKP